MGRARSWTYVAFLSCGCVPRPTGDERGCASVRIISHSCLFFRPKLDRRGPSKSIPLAFFAAESFFSASVKRFSLSWLLLAWWFCFTEAAERVEDEENNEAHASTFRGRGLCRLYEKQRFSTAISLKARHTLFFIFLSWSSCFFEFRLATFIYLHLFSAAAFIDSFVKPNLPPRLNTARSRIQQLSLVED